MRLSLVDENFNVVNDVQEIQPQGTTASTPVEFRPGGSQSSDSENPGLHLTPDFTTRAPPPALKPPPKRPTFGVVSSSDKVPNKVIGSNDGEHWTIPKQSYIF